MDKFLKTLPAAVAAILLAMIGLLLLLFRPTPAQADGVVTDCSTQQGLADAMNSGSGLITFSCGPAPVTIVITQDGGFNAVAGSAYTIDGGNLVTLSGGNNNRIFNVTTTAALTLSNLTLSHGYAAAGGPFPDQGGAILNNGGVLVLNNTIVRDSTSTYAGGAIENAYGTTTLVDSLIENNYSDYGGGIDSIGTLTLIHTTVRGNHALLHTGGGLDISGIVFIDNSLIVSNTANFDNGGGINSVGTLTLTNSTLRGNSALYGGGIANFGGGATATLTDATLTGNSAGADGGGISNGYSASLIDVTLSGNSAVGDGGGIWNKYSAYLTNVTLSSNSAGGNGGGIYNLATAKMFNATIVFNQADSDNNATGTGGGVFNYSGVIADLHNSLVAGNMEGNGTNDCAGQLYSSGRNLVSVVGGCTLSNLGGGHWSLLSTPASMSIGPLQNNGGPTLTHMPRLGSEIIDGGDPVAGCIKPGGALLLFDQRGRTRPIDGDGNGTAICDVGAVERQLNDSDLAPRLWLPLIVR